MREHREVEEIIAPKKSDFTTYAQRGFTTTTTTTTTTTHKKTIDEEEEEEEEYTDEQMDNMISE